MPTPTTATNKERRIAMSMKIQPSVRDFIDQAAALVGKNRSEFILDSALASAQNTILEQTVFGLGAAQFETFEAALHEPVDVARVRELFSRKAPWE